MSNSFNTGNISTSSGLSRLGGLIGDIHSGNNILSNSVSLGSQVAITAGSGWRNRVAGRNSGTLEDNRARSDMLLIYPWSTNTARASGKARPTEDTCPRQT